MPLVSIITPVYNAAQWLPETISSVQAQTLADWELILVDDCSTDESVAIAESMAAEDKRIKTLRMPHNSGPAAARQKALEFSNSRFITFLDADDLFLPDKLACSVKFMTEHNYGFIYHDFRYMSFDGSYVGTVVHGPEELNWHNLHTHRGVSVFAVMIDRQKILNFHIYPGFFNYLHQDFIMWLRLIQDGNIGHRLPADLGRYRLLHNSLNVNKVTSAIHVWRIYRDISNLPFLCAAYWWVQYAWNSVWQRKYSYPKGEKK